MIETSNLVMLVIVLSLLAAWCFSIAIDAANLMINDKPYLEAGAIFAFLALCVGFGTYYG